MSKYGLGDLHQALRTYLQSGFDAGQVVEAGNVPAPFLRANRTWVPAIWTGCYVQITDGAGIGQFQEIFDNSNNEISLVDPWTIVPDTTSVFKIMPPPPGLGTASPVEITNTSDIESSIDSGTVTARTGDTLSDSAKNWPVDGLTDALVKITDGTGVGQLRVIASNTATQLTVATAWATQPGIGASYSIISLGGGGGGGVPAGVYSQSSVTGDIVGGTLDLTLDTGENGGRNIVNVHAWSSVDSTWTVQVSVDNANWRFVEDFSVAPLVESHIPYADNAYRYIRVLTADVGTHGLEIVASR